MGPSESSEAFLGYGHGDVTSSTADVFWEKHEVLLEKTPNDRTAQNDKERDELLAFVDKETSRLGAAALRVYDSRQTSSF